MASPGKRELHVFGRVVAFGIYLGVLYLVLVGLTGRWVPTNGEEDIWFASAVGFLAYALFDTPFFVPPSQVVASGVPSALLLLTFDFRRVEALRQPLEFSRWAGIAIATATVAAAAIAIALRDKESPASTRTRQIAYRLATRFGDGAVMFTPPALLSIIGFHQGRADELLWLTFIWVALIGLRPVELVLEIVRDLRSADASATGDHVGVVQRVDSPNIIRVALKPGTDWSRDRLRTACLASGKLVTVVPLFVQTQSGELVGTGLIHGTAVADVGATAGAVYAPANAQSVDAVVEELAGGPACTLVGFVVEDSRIKAIEFEVAADAGLAAGTVVFCRQEQQSIYYQILDARTREETFQQNPRGTHIVTAGQLGYLVGGKTFRRYDWLPRMNAPVFLPSQTHAQAGELKDGTFEIGRVPHFDLPVYARVKDMLEHHTAILGVTGTGKTELAFDIIKQAHSAGSKIFCVDFTGEYKPRLEELKPRSLDLSRERMKELRQIVDDIETGPYKGADAKKEMLKWEATVKPEVWKEVSGFLEDGAPAVGLFELPDIANTRATLRATELYLSAIFAWARANRRKRSILVALEEAHTIIPEQGIFGYDNNETAAVIARMAQIALQGRKYGVGLLLVSQRTALVSKTLLSQCNTLVSFALHDKTSLDYLQGVLGEEHVKAIPRLPFRQAIAHGKGILSDAPILIEIPEDPKKRDASERLNAQEEPVKAAM